MIFFLEVEQMLEKGWKKMLEILFVTLLHWEKKILKLKCCLDKLVRVFSLVQHVIEKLEVWSIRATEVNAAFHASANNVEIGWLKLVLNQIARVVNAQNCLKTILDITGSGMRIVGSVKILFNVFQTSISGSSTVGKTVTCWRKSSTWAFSHQASNGSCWSTSV